MFTKKAEQTSARPGDRRPPMPASRPTAAATPIAGRASVIAPDLVIQGNLSSAGEIQIDGEVQGEVRAKRILVGKRGFVAGVLIANEIIVEGSVQGSIRGEQVVFRPGCQVDADVFHKSLTIEQGAFFEGKSRRTNDPMSVPVEDVAP